VTIYDASCGVNPEWRGRFIALCQEIAAGDDRLAPNYAFENLDLDGHMILQALVDERGFRACAGVYRREFWPPGIWRFQNRTWIRPEARHDMTGAAAKAEGGDGWFDVADHLGGPQIALARDAGAHALFLSIEGPRAFARLRYMRDRVRPRWRADDVEWRISPGYVQVAPGDASGSWQPILYANTFPGFALEETEWFQRSKTFEEWSASCPS
jgi:hypothetical protein